MTYTLYRTNTNITSDTVKTATEIQAWMQTYFIPKEIFYSQGNVPISPHIDLLTITFLVFFIRIWKAALQLSKKAWKWELFKEKSAGNISRILAKQEWYFVQFHTTDHWLPDILNESCRELFQMVKCQGQNCNAVYCHTQFITTQRSNAFKLN